MKKILLSFLLAVSTTFAVETSEKAPKTITIDNTRAVLIKGPVDSYNMEYAIKSLNEFASDSTKPVYLVLNSPGGSVLDGFELVNTLEVLESKKIETICVVETMAYSMAAILATYCSKTYIHKFASLMYHPASYGISGSVTKINTRVNFTNNYLHILSKDVAKRLKMTVEAYEAKVHDEWWLTAEEALRAGIVVGILDSVSYTIAAPEPPPAFSLFGRKRGMTVTNPLEESLE